MAGTSEESRRGNISGGVTSAAVVTKAKPKRDPGAGDGATAAAPAARNTPEKGERHDSREAGDARASREAVGAPAFEVGGKWTWVGSRGDARR